MSLLDVLYFELVDGVDDVENGLESILSSEVEARMRLSGRG